MPHWLIKSGIQHVLARLPQRQKWNYYFQRYATRSLQLGNAMFERRLLHCRTHLETLVAARGAPPDRFTALELGTGWFPTMAVGLYLCGAESVWTIDIDPLLRRPQMRRMLELYLEYADKGLLQKHLPRLLPERLKRLRILAPEVEVLWPEEFLERMNIHHAVRDAQQTGCESQSVDLIFSTGVLEYIPVPVLQAILKEFRRVITPCGSMSHWISMIDQFWYFDKSITPFNYMKYTTAQWRWFNSPLIWQNRLRQSDYRKMIIGAGFRVVREDIESGDPKDLQSIQLAPEFQGYAREDLLTLMSWVMAVPTPTAGCDSDGEPNNSARNPIEAPQAS